ncbi:hypothetical protein LIER_15126 [Lithospermum erythrorhizon]|uniref:Uncharacterized protein n=1 Tax=Lithospermum erythrorhizon TaxID=34254 RepID=A0AAV3Q363_LITER
MEGLLHFFQTDRGPTLTQGMAGNQNAFGATIVNDIVTPRQVSGKYMENHQIGHQGDKKGRVTREVEAA